MEKVSPFAIFRNRNFSLLWNSQLISELGSSITSLAAGIYVYKISGSVVNLSLMMIASMAPSLLIGLFAGVFVDRYDRKQIMVITSLLRAILVLAIPFLIHYNLAWMYILVFLSAAVGQFFNPAQSSVLPDVTSEHELNAANSLMAISTYGSLVIGYGLAGFFVDRFPIEWAFYIDAFTFLACALLLGLMRIPPFKVEEETSARVVMNNLVAGAKFIFVTPILRSLFIVFSLLFIDYGFINTLRLPFTIQELNASASAYGVLEGLTLIGFVVASLLMARMGDRLREGQWLAISFIGMGLTSVAFGLSSSINVAYIIIVVEGFVNAPSVIARSLVMQRNSPREMRGRVFGNFFVMRDTMFIVGIAIAGFADLFDVRLMFLLGSLYGLAIGLVVLVLPGLGQPAAEWRKAIRQLRAASQAPRIEVGNALAMADFAHLAALVPALGRLEAEKQEHLRQQMELYEAPDGTAVVRQGDDSDAAYFILEGQVVVGLDREDVSYILNVLRQGDFFGEIAALKGIPRTAHVVAQQPTRLVKVPAETLREMVEDPELHSLFTTRMEERLAMNSLIDAVRTNGMNPDVLRELRTSGE
jgi:MFS family permease